MLSRGRVKVVSTEMAETRGTLWISTRSRAARAEGCRWLERKNTCAVPLMILYRRSLIHKRLEDFLHYKFESAVWKRCSGGEDPQEGDWDIFTRARLTALVFVRQFHSLLVQHARLTNISFNELPERWTIGYSFIDTPRHEEIFFRRNFLFPIALLKNLYSAPNNNIIMKLLNFKSQSSNALYYRYKHNVIKYR